jgi:hypothetical protein
MTRASTKAISNQATLAYHAENVTVNGNVLSRTKAAHVGKDYEHSGSDADNDKGAT